MPDEPTPPESPHLIGSANVFCADGSYLDLEQDWRRGLGWWRVEGRTRQRLTVSDAVEVAPRDLAHEVLLEAARLVAMLELDARESGADDPGMGEALEELRKEVAAARQAHQKEWEIVGRFLADRL